MTDISDYDDEKTDWTTWDRSMRSSQDDGEIDIQVYGRWATAPHGNKISVPGRTGDVHFFDLIPDCLHDEYQKLRITVEVVDGGDDDE